MKKLLVKTSDNVQFSQQNVFLSRGDDSVRLTPGGNFRLHIKGFIKDMAGDDLTTIWTVSSKLFGSNVFLRGVEQVADGWQMVLDCSVLSKEIILKADDAILVGRAYETITLHRIGSDVTTSGARIL